MPNTLPTPAEQPNILPAEKPAWLNARTLITLILVLGAGIALVLWQTSKSEKAREESNRLLTSKADTETWSKLIREYPGQPATAIALLESAAEATEKNDPRKAAGLYDQFSRDYPKHPLRSAARFAQANSLAAAGDRGVAQTLFLSMITERPPNPFRTGAAVGLATLQIAENRPEAARQVLNDILAENTGSAFLPDARALLEKLPPPPISASAPSLPVPPPAPAPAKSSASQPAK
jgi:thioredoxin-like negative regulator of GroEL